MQPGRVQPVGAGEGRGGWPAPGDDGDHRSGLQVSMLEQLVQPARGLPGAGRDGGAGQREQVGAFGQGAGAGAAKTGVR